MKDNNNTFSSKNLPDHQMMNGSDSHHLSDRVSLGSTTPLPLPRAIKGANKYKDGGE